MELRAIDARSWTMGVVPPLCTVAAEIAVIHVAPKLITALTDIGGEVSITMPGSLREVIETRTHIKFSPRCSIA
jgi:hypothetical protein